MEVDLFAGARQAALTLLKARTQLTDLVPVASIVPASGPSPAWPFVRLGPSALPVNIRAAGAEHGGLVTFPVHAFAGPKQSGGADTHTAERHASMIGHQISIALHRKRVEVSAELSVYFTLTDRMLIADEDADRWHWSALVNARMLAA